jgi:phage-related minor tail protein
MIMTVFDFIHDIFAVLVNFIMQIVYMVILIVHLIITADPISVLIFGLLCMVAIGAYGYHLLAQNHQLLR